MQSLCTLRDHCRQWPRNTRYQADATPYLGRTSTGWIAPAYGWRTHSITSSARPSVMNSRRSDAHLLTGGLRRRLPRDESPTLRCFCPSVEEHEPQAARLAVDLRLDRRATGDECGVAHETHLAIAAGHALVLPLSRAQGRKPRRLGVGEARGIGIKKLVVKHRLERAEIAAAHRRAALVLEGVQVDLIALVFRCGAVQGGALLSRKPQCLGDEIDPL